MTNNKFKQYLKDKLLFGNEPTPELIAFLTVYFVQGILGIANLAVSFYLKDDLGLSPAQVAALMGIAVLPWVIKPVFGFISDGLPLFGYRRRSYLILSGLLGTVSWLALATLVDSAATATIAILLTRLSIALSDVIIDSLIVERSRTESLGTAGSLQSLGWSFSALGGLITAYFSGWLLERVSSQTVFAITAIFPLLVSLVATLVAEERITPESKPVKKDFGVSQQIKQLWSAISQKTIWLPVAFLFIWQATPSTDSAFFFFTTNELGFSPEFLGRVRLVTSLAALLGIWLFQRFLKTVGFRIIFAWSTVIASALGMTTLLLVTHANRAIGIDDHWFSLGDSVILTVMGSIAWMPILVLCARLCPPGIEATFFALLMSICNLSGILSQEFGALLTAWLGVTETNFDNLWLLLVIANLSTLLPLPFIGWLPAGDPKEMYEQNLPPGEVFEQHPPGSMPEQPFMPDLVPELVKTVSEGKKDG